MHSQAHSVLTHRPTLDAGATPCGATPHDCEVPDALGNRLTLSKHDQR